jgi:hypothetical protein
MEAVLADQVHPRAIDSAEERVPAPGAAEPLAETKTEGQGPLRGCVRGIRQILSELQPRRVHMEPACGAFQRGGEKSGHAQTKGKARASATPGHRAQM